MSWTTEYGGFAAAAAALEAVGAIESFADVAGTDYRVKRSIAVAPSPLTQHGPVEGLWKRLGVSLVALSWVDWNGPKTLGETSTSCRDNRDTADGRYVSLAAWNLP